MVYIVSTLRTKDQQKSFRPLINSTIDQFLADLVPVTVQDLFPSRSSNSTPAAEEHPRLSNPWNSDHVSYVASLMAERSHETFVFRKATVCCVYVQVTSLDMCDYYRIFSKECVIHLHKFCFDWQTVIFPDHFGAKKLNFAANGSKHILCQILCIFF